MKFLGLLADKQSRGMWYIFFNNFTFTHRDNNKHSPNTKAKQKNPPTMKIAVIPECPNKKGVTVRL